MADSQLFTILVSIGGAVISGVSVAVLNNLFQRHREELKMLREKGEEALTSLNNIHRIVARLQVDHRFGSMSDQEMSQTYGFSSDNFTYIDNHLKHTETLINVYFPDCRAELRRFQLASLHHYGAIISTRIVGNEHKDLNVSRLKAKSLQEHSKEYDAAMIGLMMSITDIIDDNRRSDSKYMKFKRHLTKTGTFAFVRALFKKFRITRGPMF